MARGGHIGAFALVFGAVMLGAGAVFAARRPAGLPARTPALVPAPPAALPPVDAQPTESPIQKNVEAAERLRQANQPTQDSRVFLTKASIALGRLTDPYNPDLDLNSIAARKAKLLQSEVGGIYKGIRGIVESVPVVGAILAAFDAITDGIGGLLQKSEGGWTQSVGLPQKRRVEWLIPGYGPIPASAFKSQQYDAGLLDLRGVGIIHAQPAGSYDPTLARPAVPAMTDEQYAAYVRGVLIWSAQQQQFQRIIRTVDEAIFPGELIAVLLAYKLWPPPLEPLPLTEAEWRKKYPQYAQWTNFLVPSYLDPRRDAIAQAARAKLLLEYQRDALMFSTATRGTEVTSDIAALIAESDMVPPRVELANFLNETHRPARGAAAF